MSSFISRRNLLLAGVSITGVQAQQNNPLRIGIAGLVHGHVSGFLNAASKRDDCRIVALADPTSDLRSRYGGKFNVPESGMYASTAEMIDRTKPEVVACFGSTYDHTEAVETCAAK